MRGAAKKLNVRPVLNQRWESRGFVPCYPPADSGRTGNSSSRENPVSRLEAGDNAPCIGDEERKDESWRAGQGTGKVARGDAGLESQLRHHRVKVH
ncbi:hypothetical protein COCON_G00119190 [Conger conger]|uniref:Uncharacterized protein n=1 Tax=Conger conger TaxID=82655 RepID=A0A9Q1DGH4_CONCO|nr:hypothetical protein COCON_G00119190 [Conger conger]